MSTRYERIQEELRGKLTGFDELLKAREDNIKKVQQFIFKHPDVTRAQLSEVVGVSKRTISRYLSELRKGYKIRDISKDQLRDKKARVVKLKKLIRSHPEYSKVELAQQLRVCKRTLAKYFAELEIVE